MVNPFLCPWCGKLAVRNTNVFPQKMWNNDRQEWSCEQCGKPIVRMFTSAQWWTRWLRRSTFR